MLHTSPAPIDLVAPMRAALGDKVELVVDGSGASGHPYIESTDAWCECLFDWTSLNLSIQPVDVSHAIAAKIRSQNFVAINSAIQVDLSGRANFEFVGDKRVSNVGGVLDFARRANHEKFGKKFIASQATAKSGQISRIVNSFADQRCNSLAGTHIDNVVTEYGIADLRGQQSVKKRSD